MSKKNFKTGFGSLLGETDDQNESPKEKIVKKRTKTATFVVVCDQYEKIKSIAFMESKMLKDILEDALSDYIINYENQNGSVVLPKK
ncbi:MAG: hypothetical protein DGJ47_001064 [Rickettsiaceae bacterium]